MSVNRPHFHPWLKAATGRAFFRARSFHTRQAARQWALRRAGADDLLVRPCTCTRCKPALD